LPSIQLIQGGQRMKVRVKSWKAIKSITKKHCSGGRELALKYDDWLFDVNMRSLCGKKVRIGKYTRKLKGHKDNWIISEWMCENKTK